MTPSPFPLVFAAVLLFVDSVSSGLLRGTTDERRDYLSSSTVEYKDNKMAKIVGGDQVDSDTKYPWFVSVRRGDGHWCGGALVSSRHVLSAAHCFDDQQNWTPTKVVVNAYKRNDEKYEQHILKTVRSISFHPKYRNQNYEFEFDAAILTIDEVDINDMSELPILASPPLNGAAKLVPAHDKLVTVLGMGQSDKQNSHITVDTLKEVNLKTWSHLHCDALYHRIREDSQVCVGPVSNEEGDGCRGDSGGPMFAKSGGTTIIYGIVSHAAGCAKVDSNGRVWPSVFSRVSAIYDWACDMSSNEIGGCRVKKEEEETPVDMMTSDSVVIVPPTVIQTDPVVLIDGNSDDSCGIDNDHKRLKIGRIRQTCAWVRNEANVLELCEQKDVSKHCKATCCHVSQVERNATPDDASDDPSFIFYDRNRTPKTCQWLSTRQKEVELYCSRVSGVAEKCAATCGLYLDET